MSHDQFKRIFTQAKNSIYATLMTQDCSIGTVDIVLNPPKSIQGLAFTQWLLLLQNDPSKELIGCMMIMMMTMQWWYRAFWWCFCWWRMCGKETEGDQQTITALYIQSPTNSRIHKIYTVYTTYTYTTTIYIPYTSSHRPTLGCTIYTYKIYRPYTSTPTIRTT